MAYATGFSIEDGFETCDGCNGTGERGGYQCGDCAGAGEMATDDEEED